MTMMNEIKSGDFVTTNEQLAKDYAGEGKVISMEVNANEILDDKTKVIITFKLTLHLVLLEIIETSKISYSMIYQHLCQQDLVLH
jgi:hypothetical protein